MASSDRAEPFPRLSPSNTQSEAPVERTATNQSNFSRSANTSVSRRNRGPSFVQSLLHSNPPLGMWQATGEVGSKIPTLPEIKNGSFAAEGWSHEGQMERRGNNPHEIHRRRLARTSSASTRTRRGSATPGVTPTITEETGGFFPKRGSVSMQEPVIEEVTTKSREEHGQQSQRSGQQQQPSSATPDMAGEKVPATGFQQTSTNQSKGPDETGKYPNGYRFPKKHSWTQATVIGMKALWKFFLTPFGFLITVYGLNVIGWGAMIFFVLLNAAPAMCHPSCSAENSSRKIWIEIDSQVLNGLFCVTGFGLIPWRFRDFYYLMKWRVSKSHIAHRRLAGIYRGWYRLPGSDQLAQDLGPPPKYNKKHAQNPEAPPPYTPEQISTLESNPAIPLPATSMPEPPLTGVRGLPSKSRTLDIVIWMYMLNTGFQGCLAGVMWGFNRHNRPSWTTGLFITLGCVSGIVAGIVVFIEGSKVKKLEGIPVHEYDVLESPEDFQERKGKEEAKEAKKHQHDQDHHHHHLHHHDPDSDRLVIRSEKIKGEHWFTRH